MRDYIFSESMEATNKKENGRKMFDVKVKGKVIARASTEEESRIYKLDFEGLKTKEIAASLHLPLEFVKRYTEGYSTR
jgi:DNA-binding NarL/FixJ family response regulator